MKKITFLVVLVMLVAAPMSIMAMSHGKDSHGGHDMKEEKSSHMDHGKMKSMDHGKMDHDSMMAEGGMMMLGTEVKEGVKARVHIKDVSEAMAKMGMDHTHHLMVNFTSEKNGAAIEKGTVAVKVISPDETEAKPVKMMRRLAAEEGIFAGVSSGGAIAAALRLSREVENAVIVAIICDRGDRYLSTGVFDNR